MATVCHPDTGRVTASFAGVAKHYGVRVAICPPRAGHRKGVVEKVNHTAAQRWWRTLADDLTVEQARASLDAFAATRGDTRMRPGPGGKTTVATLAAAEPLRPAPVTAYPVRVSEERVVSRQALIAYRGNRYAVPPELAGARVEVVRKLDTDLIDIITRTGTGNAVTIARHRLAADGTGAVIRDHGHVIALETAAMAAAAATNGGRPHRRKERIPPGPAALAAAQVLTTNALRSNGILPPGADTADADTSTDAPTTVIDLAAYERAANGRNTLT
jgi:hypothetical protein